MARLVDIEDVKVLINGMDSLPWEEEIDDLVNTIPTAFDIEKVIAELKKKSHREESREYDHFFNKHITFETDKVVYLEDAKEIIEAGGVE